MATPISTDEILTSLFEFNETGDVFTEENAVLVTSCHSAKGLEFQKVILLSNGFRITQKETESERRLFYVAMTRAKDELVLCSVKKPHRFVKESGVSSVNIDLSKENISLAGKMLYLEMTPKDVHLGYNATKKSQQIIRNLHEGDPLQMCVSRYGNGWIILTSDGEEIGKLSKKADSDLIKKGIIPGQFQFQPGEVTVQSIFHHIGIDKITGKITEEWFVIIPQIRICR